MATDNPPSLAPLLGRRRAYKRRPKVGGPIVIEKGIEIPVGDMRQKYPWDAMEVGDSFFVPHAPKSLAGSVSKRSKEGPNAYVYRSVEVRGVKGIRVWRTK